MQNSPSPAVLVLLVVGLLLIAGLGWLVISYFNKHMTQMSEGEREDVNSNANRWGLIGVLPSLGISIVLKDEYTLPGMGVGLLVVLIILFSVTGHLGALLKRDKSASPALLISSLLLSLLMPLFALILAGYALSSPKNALTGIALIMAGIFGAIVDLLFYLA